MPANTKSARRLSSRRRPLERGCPGNDSSVVPRAIYDRPRVEIYGASGDANYAKITAENRFDQDTTLVRCQGFDRTGQLASLTIAISSFGLQIASTFIRTDADSSDVDDLFYVRTADGGPVPEEQHASLIAHMERALGMPPSTHDNVAAARDAGFLTGGGYDESAQYRAALEEVHKSNEGWYEERASDADANGGGGFFGDSAGSTLFDPSTYSSYGAKDRETARDVEVPHGPSIPEPKFFEKTSASSFDWNAPSAERRENPSAFAAAPDLGKQSASHSSHSYEWTVDAPDDASVPEPATVWEDRDSRDARGGLRSSEDSVDSSDPAAELSARLRVAAAEMAAAAAEFVSLERERSETSDPSRIESLQQPRLDAQETLARTMTRMQSALKERDQLRARMTGVPEEPDAGLGLYYAPSIAARVEAPPSPEWPEARPYVAPTPRPYEPPTPRPYEPRPYESWTPPSPIRAPEFIPASSTFESPSFDEGDEGFDPAPPPLDHAVPPPVTPMGDGKCIMLQGFNWESCNSHKKWFNVVADEARAVADAGFTAVWLPPPTDSVSDQGYLPRDLYNLNSFYGNVDDLRRCVSAMRQNDVCPVADIVINHRCADAQDNSGRWNLFTGKMAWDQQAITTDNPEFGGRGNPGTGEDYGPAPNVDHTKDWVREDLKRWLRWMKEDIGFGGWRFDFVKGYGGQYTGEYVGDSEPYVSVGEHWVSCNYNGGALEYNQDSHRQSTYDWCESTGGNTAAFDFTTKGILQEAVRNREYWRLQGSDGHPSGFCGKWPTHAVTFLENHDTGSTLQHWPFPTERLAEGYAYILTHPGTPTVFYDHWKDDSLREDIQELIDVRKRNDIGCNAAVHIEKAEDGCYAARIGQPREYVERGCCGVVDGSKPSICMKLGPGDWSPNLNRVGGTKWKCKASGDGWAVWEDRRFLD